MKHVDVGTLLAQGLAAHQAGRLAEAEAQYRRALKAQPRHPDALHLLGVLMLQAGKLAEAAALLRQSLDIAPAQVNVWNALSLTHRQSGDLAAEAAALEQITALQPTYAQVWLRRAEVAYALDQPEATCEHLGRFVALEPNNAEAWSNLGAVQLRLLRLADSEACLRRALAAQPDYLPAQNNLGSTLVASARWAEAIELLAVVVQHAPDDPNGWLNLGHALQGYKQHAEALVAFDRALALAPQLASAMMGRGDALQDLADHHGAIPWYERAKLLMPDSQALYEHLGLAYQSLGDMDAAIAEYRHCLALEPTCDRFHSGTIFALDHHEGQAAAAWDQRMDWNRSISARTRSLRRPHTNDRDPHRRLRIGYVSADFCQHSAGAVAMPVLRSHDHTQGEIYCYSGVTKPDAVTELVKTYADVWHDVADLSDDELDALIRADEIDILVDLSGHTAGNRLPVFAREPAPVQVTAWGYATGTGLETMHYFLADGVVVPPEARRWYAEDVINLPSVVCYEPPSFTPPVMPLPSLARGHITFGAFNRLEKVTENVRNAWAQILAAVPDSRLLMKIAGPNEQGRQRLVDDLVARGVARERIELRGHTSQLEHLAAHAEVDIMLDSFPHGGGVTSIESLLMGVPVVTVLGERVAGRLAASFLTTLGLTDLIAATPDAYIETVIRLAADRDRLLRERETLRERVFASSITDAGAYTRAVEAAYREMWTRWCERGLTVLPRGDLIPRPPLRRGEGELASRLPPLPVGEGGWGGRGDKGAPWWDVEVSSSLAPIGSVS